MASNSSNNSNINKILIVDDIYENAFLISTAFNPEQYEFKIATDGNEALKIARAYLPDIILLDIAMPEIDGYMVCNELKTTEKTKEIPIIFITAKTETSDLIKGFECGAIDYITKPYNYHELIRRVNTQLEVKHSKDIIKEQNIRLEELNKTKDRLFSIIAHDLLNPFNTLIGFAEMLDSNYEELDDATKKEFISYILSASEMGHGLLSNLLHWSRSQTGRLLFSPEKIDLHKIWAANEEYLNTFAKRKEINIKSEITQNTFIVADENMVVTILRNLVSNAIKFTSYGGTIKLTSKQRDDMYFISVIDNGIGIPKEAISKLFKMEPEFVRNGTNNEKGTGLGLIVCKELIEKHNGKLYIESEENKGSSFSFTLPKFEH